MATYLFDDLYARTMRLYEAGEYGEGLDLLTREGKAFPEQAPTILYLRSCLAARVGRPDLALQILDDALGYGYWYGERMMRDSPSWQPLQGLPAFERMVGVCVEREAQARMGPLLFTLEPVGGCHPDHPCPFLIALHGNGDSGAHALDGWGPAVAHGWLVAAVQSSQIVASGAYGWFDPEAAVREVEEQYASLRDRYHVDAARAVVAGFSMGGDIALRLALGGTVPLRGIILLGPGGPAIDDPEGWLHQLGRQAPATRDVRVVIMLGERDEVIARDAVHALADTLNRHGISCRVGMLPDQGHGYPPDMGPRIARALAFIERSQPEPGSAGGY